MDRTVPLMRLLPARAGMPRSWTADCRQVGNGYFNQYVLPVRPMNPSLITMMCRISIQCWADGTPIQIIVWANGGVVSGRGRVPAVDRRRRAVFDLPENPAVCKEIVDLAFDRSHEIHEVRYDRDAGIVCARLLPEPGDLCYPIATRTLAEMTRDLRLVALWLLEVDRDQEEYGRFYERLAAFPADPATDSDAPGAR